MDIDWDYIDRVRDALPKDLFEGIGPTMHWREAQAKFLAKEKYLGDDKLACKLSEEFNALPETKKTELEKNPGKYGAHDLSDKPEVELGLKIIAKEIFPGYRLDKYDLIELSDPEWVSRINERFPEMTPERIAKALEPAIA